MTNYDIALKAKAKRVVRIFLHDDTNARALMGWHGRGYRARLSNGGEFRYTHPDLPCLMFQTRGQDAEAALRNQL